MATGDFVRTQHEGEVVEAFVPNALPPRLDLSAPDLFRRVTKANLNLGRLDGIRTTLPNIDLFLYFYVRKEALLSSQIEGTQSSFSDLLLFEADAAAPSVSVDDVTEVTNYIAAMNEGLERLRSLPISMRLLRELHAILMRGVRGQHKRPGEFRTSQNWIGGSRPGNAHFVPPPPDRVVDLLSDLERFIHSDTLSEAPLVKAALVHVQFETIHPFLDGNGRLGRLLITLMLVDGKVLNAPLLYLSLYMKTRRSDYYRLLTEVRETGAWSDWVAFFLDGVADTAEQAHATALSLLERFEADAAELRTMGRVGDSALKVLQAMQKQPVTTAPDLIELLTGDGVSISPPTVRAALARLTELGFVSQPTDRARNKLYIYKAPLAILSEGTEPL